MAEVIIVKNQEEAGELYGRSVADLIKAKPNAPSAAPSTAAVTRATTCSRVSVILPSFRCNAVVPVPTKGTGTTCGQIACQAGLCSNEYR